LETEGAATSKDVSKLSEYADVLRDLGDHDLAAETLRRATRIEPASHELRVTLGHAYRAMGVVHFPKARAAYRTVVQQAADTPEAADAHAGLGRVFWRESLFDIARQHFEKALVINPDHAEARIGLAGTHMHAGRMHEAITLVDTAQTLSKSQSRYLQGTIEEGVRAFNRPGMWMDDTAENHLGYAKLLIRLQRIRDSLAPLRRSLNLDPKNHVAWNFFASVSMHAGDVDQAREAYQQSLAIKPDQPRTRESLNALNAATPD
jgi:Flp pilus assembly protein TadD